MAADEHLNQTQFFHGTRKEFNPGDKIEPGHEPNSKHSEGGAYFTGNAEDALWFAQRAKSTGQSGLSLYEVKPTGDYGEDPELSRMSKRERAHHSGYVSDHPLEVVRKLKMREWPGPTGEYARRSNYDG